MIGLLLSKPFSSGLHEEETLDQILSNKIVDCLKTPGSSGSTLISWREQVSLNLMSTKIQ